MTAAAITEVGFYHLLTKPLAAVLPRLLEKALAAGFKPLVWATDPALLAQLDAALWTYDAESFLPHGVIGDGIVASNSQQVFLSAQIPAGDRDLLVVVDGAWPTNQADFRRILYLFDGHDTAALATARGQWKAVKASPDLSATYWKETSNTWEKAG